MPKVLEDAYKDDKAEIRQKGYTLAYNPPPLYSRGTEWTTPAQKQSSASFTETKLAKGLYQAHKMGQHIKIAATGDGCLLLLKALQQLPDMQLNNFTLFMGAPRKIAIPLFNEVEKRGIKLASDVTKTQSYDWTCVMSKVYDSFKLANKVEGFGGDPAKAHQVIRAQARTDAAYTIGGALGAGGSGFALGNAGLNLAAGMSIIESFGGYWTVGTTTVGLLLVAAKMRNLLANSSKSSALNPHMHPTRSGTDFDAQVVIRNGGYLKSFFALARDMAGMAK
ncbi:hypothetical protein HCH_03401 [Hahella chejuensis KCTC 2396]|uniref:Uncharacterized protein n=1 Tax=Hahella chejuensis (strain KCTC 2396) TaxID=349521 RepID=Q2SGS3_HAHCH|nr:hypothetical protein [Hahella chejuensis]ABC30151.1 hypothetical protein HCH_03401 [Hahella chejuensis KCTC 2396]